MTLYDIKVTKRFNPTVKPKQLEAYVEELISK